MTERIRKEIGRLRADGDEGWLEHAAERSVSLIRAYCGIEEAPEELWRVGVLLALWIYDSRPEEGSGGVKSIREGDVAVTFDSTGLGILEKEREMLEYFSVELGKWRRMGW